MDSLASRIAVGFPRYKIVDYSSVIQDYWQSINGPSAVVDHRYEKPYRLYFSSHHSRTIKLAVATCIEGDWEVISMPVLSLENVLGACDHVGSPDVHLDSESGIYTMHIHSQDSTGKQVTFTTSSADGLTFTQQILTSEPSPRGLPFYTRVFDHGGQRYAMTKGGDIFQILHHGQDPIPVGNPFRPIEEYGTSHNYVGAIRHASVFIVSNQYYVAYSVIGDAPERIWCSELLDAPELAERFIAGKTFELLRPSESWEGAELPVVPSRWGASIAPENGIRDPFVLTRENDIAIFYSFKGEHGIGCSVISFTAFTELLALAEDYFHSGTLPLVSISGFPHSGTTLMINMLARAPHVASYRYETNQFLRRQTLFRAKALVEARHFPADTEKVLEKTPRHGQYISRISELLPGTRFVFMTRDFRDLAASLWVRYGDWEQVDRRLKNSSLALEQCWERSDTLIVLYEDLISLPEETLRLICLHTGIKYTSEMLHFHESPASWNGIRGAEYREGAGERDHILRRSWQMAQPLFDGRGRWKVDLPPELLECVRADYGALAARCGYDIYGL